MALRGMIFDIDGTLVDTNPSHVEAWRRAFKRFGLAVSPTDCAMVGDTVYDGQACQAAGVVFLGVLSGCSTESELLQAGACAVWRDMGQLYADLDRALEVASLATAASE